MVSRQRSAKSRRQGVRVAVLAALALGVFGCTKKSSSEVSGAHQSRKLHVASWSTYVSSEAVKRFTAQTGIRVDTFFYSSNEELLAKLQAGGSVFDVAIPSDYMVDTLIQLGLLKELDPALAPAIRALDSRLAEQQKRRKGASLQAKYAIPLFWGTTGLAYNTELVPAGVRGYRELFQRADLAGKFSLLDDVREGLGAALKSEGLSLNTRNPADLERAKKVLLQARSRIKAFTSDTQRPLIQGELAVAQAYMTDALTAREKTGGKIQFVLPEEGGTFWVDHAVIPAGAQNVAEAYEFLRFLMAEKELAATAQQIFVAPANSAVVAFMSKALQQDSAVFPTLQQLKKHEAIEDLGEAVTLWDRIWTEVKAAP